MIRFRDYVLTMDANVVPWVCAGLFGAGMVFGGAFLHTSVFTEDHLAAAYGCGYLNGLGKDEDEGCVYYRAIAQAKGLTVHSRP